MAEDGKDRPIERPQGGLSDKLIRAKVKLLETPPTPGHFDKRENPDPENPGETIPEEDLPVIKEAVELIDAAKAEGKIVSKAENPFGTDINNLKLEVFGDTHIYGSYPEEGVGSRSPALRALQELGPKSRKIKNVAVKLPNGEEPAFQSSDGYAGVGENWSDDMLPAFSVQAFRVAGEAIVQDIAKSQEFLEPGSAIAIIDIGDKSNTEAVMGDIALNAIEYENLRLKAERVANEAKKSGDGVKIYMGLIEGNHDSDLNNKGLANEKIKRALYGSQVFYQEVDTDYAVLALNTNFASTFWWGDFEKIKNSPLTDEEKLIVSQTEDEIRLQKDIIEKAMKSGRKLVVLAHELELVNDILPLDKSRVTDIVCGHLHIPEEGLMPETNMDGERVRKIRVGASSIALAGWGDVENPVPFTIAVKRDEAGNRVVEVKRIEIPELYNKDNYIGDFLKDQLI